MDKNINKTQEQCTIHSVMCRILCLLGFHNPSSTAETRRKYKSNGDWTTKDYTICTKCGKEYVFHP